MWDVICYLLASLVLGPALSSCREIYDVIPDKNLSHCSRKLNTTSEVGCSSRYPSSIGELVVENDVVNLKRKIQNSTSNLMVVIPLELFIDRNTTHLLRHSGVVSGLLVFSPKFSNSTADFPSSFSENSYCPNGDYAFYKESCQLNASRPQWNAPASDYAMIPWPFPVVLADESDKETWNKLMNCYTIYNKAPIDDTRCLMEIRNFMTAVQSSQTCYDRERLQNRYLSLSPYCDELGGVNLMLRARNSTFGMGSNFSKPDPTILFISRIDALSMFDRRASSALSVLPAISVMISVAAHLLNQPDVKAGNLKKNLLFVLLDNEALSFMGSQRFLFDLTHGRLARASGHPLNAESIESVIELVGVGLPQEDALSNPIYYLLSDPNVTQRFQQDDITSALWNTLNISANGVTLLNGSTVVETTLLPPSASTQAFLKFFVHRGHPISHTIISDRPAGPPFADTFVDSFLDTHWPPDPSADDHLSRLANLLADALHREIVQDSSAIQEPINGVKPGELMNCFLKDPGCELLRLHLEPEVVEFLLSLRGPVPMQTYEPVDSRSLRVSHVASHLLMGLTGERLKECPPVDEYGAFTYMYGYYNGSKWCYRSLIETATSFFFFEDGKVADPGWVRSLPFQARRFVRIFRSSSPSDEKAALILGVLLTLVTVISALLVRNYSQMLFVIPFDLPRARFDCLRK